MTSSMSERAVPTAPSERQPALDVLRGAALLGILLVNVGLMAGPQLVYDVFGQASDATGLERVIGGLIGWLVAGKFISSFSILFGLGAAVIAARAAARGRAPRRVLARRYGLLVLIGLAHTLLLFPGDVLFIYGLTGLVLLLFLRLGDRALGIWTVSLIGVMTVGVTALFVGETVFAAEGLDDGGFTADVLAAAAAGEAAYRAGDYGGVVVWNALQSSVTQSDAILSLPWFLGLFLIGVLAYRRGYALDPVAHRDALVRIARRAIPVGLVLNVPFLITGPLGTALVAGDDPSLVLVAGVGVATMLGAPVLAVGYLAALAVIVVDRGAERGLRRRLAALGRIALTGYLLQSMLAVAVFFGLRLYGRTELLGETILGELAFVALVWVVLLVLAPWWTARFRYGPFEWLWRWGTYGVRPPMRA
jgi:uncharacterized protein